MDLASLAFSIDSSDTLKAVQALEALRQTTQATTQANQDFQTQGDFLVTSMSSQGAGAARLSRQLADVGKGFQDLMTQADAARRAFDGSTASFDAWDIAQNKVEALGRAYGTTARGLDAYLQTANQLQMSSTQAAASVQRLTMALENQGAAAANIRQILSSNGVSINDLQTDQIDTLLTRIKTAFSNRPDTQQRTNDLRSVLGTFDPDVIGTFTNPNYVPIQQQQDIKIRSATDLDIARHSSAVQDERLQLERRGTQYADLRDNLGATALGGGSLYQSRSIGNLFGLLGGSWTGRTGVSDEGIQAMRTEADPESAFARDGIQSEAGRLAFYKQVQGTKITQEMLDDPSKMTLAQRTAMNAQARPQFLPSSVTGEWDYLNSGKYSDNQREIDTRDLQEQKDGVGGLQRWWNRSTRSDQNFFGNYTRTIKPPPEATALDQEGTGATLSGFGDSRIQRYQSAMGLEKSLGVYQGVTGGDTLDLAKSRGDAARAAFVGAYGGQDGEQNFKAARARASDSAQRAYLDDGAVVDANVELGLSKMSVSDSAQAKSFISYANQRGRVPLSSMAGQSLADLMDPSKSAGGNLPAGLLDQYKKQREISTQANTEQFNRGNDVEMKNLTEQGGTAEFGSAALQDLITKQTAYAKALTLTGDATEATRRAGMELAKVEAERSVQLKATIGDLEAQNRQADKYNQTMAGFGTAGSARTAASMQADLENEAAQMKRKDGSAFSGADQDAYIKAKQTSYGTDAVKNAQDISAASEQELRNQTLITGAATQRLGVQEKISRDLQIDQTFSKSMAEALASEASVRQQNVDRVQQLIDKTKQAKDETAALTAAAKAYGAAMQDNLATQTSQQVRGMAPGDRRLAARLAPINQAQDAATVSGGTFADGLTPQMKALLDTIAGTESGGRYDRRYDGTKAGAQFDLDAPHPAVRVNNSTASGRYMMQVGTFEQYAGKGATISPANQDNAAAADARDKWRQAMGPNADLDRDLQDPNKLQAIQKALSAHEWIGLQSLSAPGAFASAFSANLAVNNQTPAARSSTLLNTNPAFDAQRQAATDRLREEDATEAQGLTETEQRRRANQGKQLIELRSGNTANASLIAAGNVDPGEANPALKARIAQQQVQDGFQRQAVENMAQTDKQIETNTRLADAYRSGTKAVQDLQDKMKVEQEVQQQGIKNVDQETRLRQLLSARISEQTAATEQQAKAMRDSNENQKAINDLGPIASERDISRKQAELDIADHNRSFPDQSKEAKADYATQRNAQQTVKEQTEAVNDYRQAWSSAQSASFSALNSVITSGGKASDVVKGLASSLANIGLNTIEKSAGNWLTSAIGPLLGLGASAVGGGATADGLAAGNALFGHSATGNAWVDGNRVQAFASGGMIDRPTTFSSAGGQQNEAGEMGTEAIMPLKRMPNGDLGVSTGGGGSRGSSVVVNAPITVNGAGGSSGGSGMDPKQVAQMQSQLQEAVRQAVVAGIADEKRAGGSLYS